MLAEVSSRPELRTWTARSGEDYGIALLEMWAYLADILTFYQERIANETFLRTARLPASLVHLARMLDYRPAPGVAAAAELAFRLDRDKRIELSERLRVQSVRESRDEKPQTFETVEAVEAATGLNEMRLRPVRAAPPTRPLTRRDTTAWVRAVGAGLEAGDHVLVVGKEHREDPGSERWDVRRVTAAERDPEHGLISLDLTPRLGSRRFGVDPAEEEQQLYVLLRQAWPFGYNALEERLVEVVRKGKDDPVEITTESTKGAKLPHDADHPARLFLDDVYPDILRGDWAVLTAAVTRLDLDVPPKATQPEHIDVFPLRGTSILTEAEPLERVELLTEASGYFLELDGAFPELRGERRMLLLGVPVGGDEAQVEGLVVQDAKVLEDPPFTQVELVRPLSVPYELESVRLYANLARATHGETVRDEVLGSGDAVREFQSFGLAKAPLTYVPRPGAAEDVGAELEVRVEGVLWREVRSFYGSGPDDRVYTVRIDAEGETTIQFGDGITGARLPTGRSNITATYRYGIGRAGNVAAGAVRTLLDRPVGLRSAHNPAATGIGVDRETPEMTRSNIPNTVRTFGRIVSLRDFEDTAREAAGVAKARATFEWDGAAQAVHLTVAGEEGAAIVGDPLKGLVGRLDARRDPNRMLVVRPHVEVPVEVEATVRVHPDHLARDVLAAARAALRGHLSFEERDFGRAVHLSDVYRTLQQVAGVVSADVDVLRFKPFGTDEEFARFLLERGGTSAPVQPHLLLRASELAVIDVPEDVQVGEG